MEPVSRLGLIAGRGQMPLALARAARGRGVSVVAVGVEGETLPELAREVERMVWIPFGDVQGLFTALRGAAVRHVVMAGGVAKRRLFQETLRVDAQAAGLLGRLLDRSDATLLGALTRALQAQGFRVLDCSTFLEDTLARPGILAGPPLSAAERADVEFGRRIAKRLAGLEIGQTVVVKGQVVLAVEALEGTDDAIRRGGRVGGPGSVVVKMSRPRQDMRYDIPTVGRDTVAALREAGSRVLTLEARRTLMLDGGLLLQEAAAAGITVMAR